MATRDDNKDPKGGSQEKENGNRTSRSRRQDMKLMERVVLATLWHDGQPSYCSAREVAAAIGEFAPGKKMSPQRVVSLMRKAFKEHGMFSNLIHLPQDRKDAIWLADAVRAKFGLRQVLLVPGYREILEELSVERRRLLHQQVIRAMAGRVAELLDARVAEAVRQHHPQGTQQPSLRIGVAWGRTMHLIADHLLSTPRAPRTSDLEVVPIIGITSTRNTLPVEANVVAMNFARAYGGYSAQLPCPAFVLKESYRVAIQAPEVREMLRTIDACHVVVSSMGPVLENGDDADMTLSGDPEENAKLVKDVCRSGAVGEACFNCYDRDGNEVRTSYRAIGLGFEGFRTIARDPQRQVILVSGGDKRRFEPLKVALKAGLANILVSCTTTAEALLGRL